MTVIFEHEETIQEIKQTLTGIGLTLGTTEERLIKEKPERLITWKENRKIIGHTIWHASNT